MTVLAPGCGPNAPIVAGTDARAAAATRDSGTGTLHSFTLHNTSGTAATAAMARLGLAFTKGDVSARQRLAVRVQGGQPVAFAAAAATNRWADGSLRSTADAGLVMVDSSPIAAGKSRTYEVYAVAGSPGKSGFDPFAWLAAHGNDLTVAVTARTGSATGAKPDLLFSLKTAIQTTTRREILCDTSRFVRIKAWQKVPQEEHLICEYHLDFWLDASAQPIGLEFAPVLSQHWWVADPFGKTQAKERYTYDAVVKYGTTVLDSRGRLDHAYYCRWASLRPEDDAQHARKHWIGLGLSEMPTVRVQYADASLKRMMKAGYIPPLRLGVAYQGDPVPSAYAPLGVYGFNADINTTGGSIGRGIWSSPNAKLVNSQAQSAATAEAAWQSSRISAQAGLSVYVHVRDHRLVNGATTNRLIPQTIRRISGGTQSYPGLASPVVYANGSFVNAGSLPVLAHSAPAGGTGAFMDYDGAHLVNYSGPMAFLEGETYLSEAANSNFNAQCYFGHFNEYNHDMPRMYYEVVARRNAEGIPSDPFGSIPALWNEERGFAWLVNIMNQSYMLTADRDPELPFLKNMILNSADWLSSSYDYFPAAHRDKGIAWIRSDRLGVIAPWENFFQSLALNHSTKLFDFLPANARGMNGFAEAAFKAGRYVVDYVNYAPYGMEAYRSLWATDANGSNVLPRNELPFQFKVNFSSGIGSLADGWPLGELRWQVGDTLRFNVHEGVTWQSLPSGIDTSTRYYLVNATATTFQISSSPGGTPVQVGDISGLFVYISLQSFQAAAMSQAIFWPPEDSYTSIGFAAFESCVGNAHPDISTQIRDKGRNFIAARQAYFTSVAVWNYDGGNIL